MVYTSTDILNAVKRNQTLASSSFRFSDTDILAMANEEIESTIVPMIIRLHSDRLIYSEPVVLVANQSSYNIPYRAIGGQLRELFYQDTATNPSFTRNLKLYDYTYGAQLVQTGVPYGFYFSSDTINLTPKLDSTTTGYLMFSYHMKHGALVSTSSICTITSVNYNTGVISLTANAPSTITTSTYCDFLQANQRCKPRLLAYDKIPTNIGSSQITFNTADIPTGLISGDKIALATQTDTLLLPDECFKYVVKAIEVKIIAAQKDMTTFQAMQPELDKARRVMEGVLDPRIQGEAKVVINRNGLINRRYRKKVLPDLSSF